jgi:hypothetical protein
MEIYFFELKGSMPIVHLIAIYEEREFDFADG